MEFRGEDKLLEEGSIDWACWILRYILSDVDVQKDQKIYGKEVIIMLKVDL